MEIPKHLKISVSLLLLSMAMGISGYMIIEGWSFMDALYMTVISMTTVGYGEIHQMSFAGRVFTIMVICSGVLFFLYVTSALVQYLVEGQILNALGRRTLNKKIQKMKDHHIVCGYGRIGRVLVKNLRAHGIEPIVIENNPELVTLMDQDGVIYVNRDATEEDSLNKAGISRAKVLIAALGTDTHNVFLVLTARQLNPDIFILARADKDATKTKLFAAGANRVESPYDIGAISMAQRVLRPSVSNFIDLVFAYNRKDIQMDEIPVDPASPLVNQMLKDSGIRQQYNLIIIAIKKPDGDILFNPSHESVLCAGDTVIAMGKSEKLIELEKVLCPQKATPGMI
ncbi:MAG: potassium channel family protein [Thermodesulfobacteriota bacterium]